LSQHSTNRIYIEDLLEDRTKAICHCIIVLYRRNRSLSRKGDFLPKDQLCSRIGTLSGSISLPRHYRISSASCPRIFLGNLFRKVCLIQGAPRPCA
jgi:hypothetical protein